LTIEFVPYHVGIATPNIETTMDELGQLFDLTWTPINSGRDFRLASPDGDVDETARRTFASRGAPRFELLEGSPGSVWAPHRGLHVHHVAYWSDAVTEDCHRLVADGWALERWTYDDAREPVTFAYLVRGNQRVELVDVARRPAHEALFETTGT
jgi:hypothetical protein